MNTTIKIALLVIVAILVIAASRSVDPSPPRNERVELRCYSEEEVRLLMNANGWSKGEAVRVLELSCEYAVEPVN